MKCVGDRRTVGPVQHFLLGPVNFSHLLDLRPVDFLCNSWYEEHDRFWNRTLKNKLCIFFQSSKILSVSRFWEILDQNFNKAQWKFMTFHNSPLERFRTALLTL